MRPYFGERENALAGIETLGVGQLFARQVFGVVYVKNEQLSRVEGVYCVKRRAARVEMERIEHEPDVVAVDFLDDLAGEIERLDGAIRLAEEFKSERDAVLDGDVAHFVQNADGLGDNGLAHDAGGQFAGDNDDVGAAEAAREGGERLALGEHLVIIIDAAKCNVFDGVYRIGLDAGGDQFGGEDIDSVGFEIAIELCRPDLDEFETGGGGGADVCREIGVHCGGAVESKLHCGQVYHDARQPMALPGRLNVGILFTNMKNLLIVLLVMIFAASFAGAQSDAELRAVVEKDKTGRDAAGKLLTLTAAEHATRGEAYFANRHFAEAREHYQIVLDKFADDPLRGRAMFVVGRSYMWERQYADAIVWLERMWREFPATKDGREALAFRGACHVRLRKYAEAAAIYEQYTVMYPTGERIDSAYLNTIDALREAGNYAAADGWVEKARQRFAGTPTETNALHARLRMEIYRRRWPEAVAAADVMIEQANFGGAMATMDEIKYLKAFALEKSGRRADAMAVYASIPSNMASYYSGLAADKLAVADTRVKRIVQVSPSVLDAYPAAYREDVLRYAKKRRVDARFILAIMKQESAFRPGAKSPSAARGLMQFVFDTAVKYKDAAGFPHLRPDDLYLPQVSIALGVEYIAALRDEFGTLNEAIAASYNGGEDNAARWLSRSDPKEPAIFASEIGFAETKNYVFKVMSNYRVYRDLYDEHLLRR